MKKGFTLIELLIVVAIIAILAAIAVPNFLEAQTRSKIARSKADMRSVDLAIQAYMVDYNTKPRTTAKAPADRNINWWGFVSWELTTPIAYITSMPAMIFTDETVLAFWQQLGGNQNNQPYTYIRNTFAPSHWGVGVAYGGANPKVGNHVLTQEWHDKALHSGYILYTAGPDRLDSTVWGAAVIYDPTNGTMSFGDIHTFGPGESPETEQAGDSR